MEWESIVNGQYSAVLEGLWLVDGKLMEMDRLCSVCQLSVIQTVPFK